MPKISDQDAIRDHGVVTNHERMDQNGELRFRLNFPNGNSYIKTQSSATGGWQKSHYHEQLKETYIVEQRWIALAEWRKGSLRLVKYELGQNFTTEPKIAHNIYMPGNSVISTVKHGSSYANDWHDAPELDAMTTGLSEKAILTHATPANQYTNDKVDERVTHYVALYNNLDTILWRIPAFAIAIISVFFVLIARGSQSEATASIFSSSLFLSFVSFFPAVLLLIASYSMYTIRKHHTFMGDQLWSMESGGYFHDRKQFLSTNGSFRNYRFGTGVLVLIV